MITKENLRTLAVSPTVAEVGKVTRMSIISIEGRNLLDEGKSYDISVYPMTRKRALASAEPDARVNCTGGMLSFEYCFDNEEEYELRIRQNDAPESVKPFKISVYALEADLYELRPLKGDMHIHTDRSDGKISPATVASDYRRYGYDFISVTDHNRYFGSLEAMEAYSGVPTDLNIIYGEEVHTPGSDLHIVHFGGLSSVARLYVKERAAYESDVAALEKTLPEGEYSGKLAKAIWATRRIHEAGGLAILPHPFWINNVYNINLKFLKILFESGLFDAYELLGAMKTSGGNLSVAYFHDLQRNGFDMPVVASSDSHNTLGSTPFGDYFTIVFAKDNTRESIIEAIKAKRTAAVEYVPMSGQKEYRVYAPFRLVMLTRFLMDNYFDRTREMFEAEGHLMRHYSLGIDGSGQALAALHGRGERFYNFFYGKGDSDFFKPEHIRALSRKYDGVWTDYGVTRRGSVIDDPKK